MADYDLGTARGTVIIDAAGIARAQGALNAFGNGLIALGAVAVAGFAVAANAAANFEQKISGFEAVTNATEADLEKIRQKALQLGRDTIFSALDVAEGFEILGKAGLTATEVLNGAGEAATLLAAAGDLGISRAAEIAANAMRTFSLQAEDLPHVADTLAAAANRSTVEVDDLATSLKYVGGVAAVSGLSIDDTVVAIGQLGNVGIRGSTAGTVLRRMLLNLHPVSVKAEKAMRDLKIITEEGGNAFFTAEGKVKSFREIQEILQTATEGLSDAEKQKNLNIIFGNRAVAGALLLARGGAEAYDEFAQSLEGMTAAGVAGKRLDNLRGDIEILRGSIETLLVTGGTPFQDMLRGWVQGITDFVNMLTKLSPRQVDLINKTLLFGGAALIATGTTLKLGAAVFGAYKRLRDFRTAVILANESLALLSGVDVLGTIGAALAGIAGGIAAIVTSPLFILAAIVAALAGGFYLLYTRVQGFHDAFEPMVDSVRNALGDMGDFFISVGGDWLDFFRQLGPDAEEAFGHIKNAASDVFENWRKVVAAELRGIGRVIRSGLDTIRRIWDRLWDNWGVVLQTAWDQVQNIVSNGTEFLQRLIAGFTFIINGDWQSAWNNFKEIPGIAWNAMLRTLGNLGRLLWNALQGAVETALQLGQDIIGGIRDGAEIAWTKVVEFVRSIPDKIRGAIELGGNALEWLRTKGVDLIQGLLEGAQAKGLELGKWLQDLPAKLLGAVGNLLKTLKEKGEDLLLGLSDGFDDGFKKYSKYLSDEDGLRQDLSDAVGDLYGTFRDKGGPLIAGLRDGIIENAPQIVLAVGAILFAFASLPAVLAAVAISAGIAFIGGILNSITGNGWLTLLAFVTSLPFVLLLRLLSNVPEWFNAGKKWLGELRKGIEEGAKDVLIFFASLPFKCLQKMADAPFNFWNTAKRWLLGGSPGFLTGLQDALPQVLAFFTSLPGRCLAAMGDIAQNLFDKGVSFMQSFGNGLKSKFENDVLPFLSGLGGRILDGLGDIGGLIGGAFSGAGTGIDAAVGRLAEKAEAAGRGLTGGFKKGAGIGSPSDIERLMFGINDSMERQARILAQQTKEIMDIGRQLDPTATNGGLSSARAIGLVPVAATKPQETGGTNVPTTGGDVFNVYPVNPTDPDQLAREIMWRSRVRVR